MTNMNQTVYFRPKKAKPATLFIVDKSQKVKLISLRGNKTVGRLYPEANCDILLDSLIVGRRHGEFIFDDSDGSYYYIDNNSKNGTFINGQKLEPYNDRGSKAYKLSDGDIIRIDRRILENPHPEAILIIFSTSFDEYDKWTEFNIGNLSSITIGRDSGNTIVLNDMMSSRNHAIMRKKGGEWYVTDQKSKNGVEVNGTGISKNKKIFDHDVISIGNTTLVILKEKIIYNITEERNSSLSIAIEKRTVRFGKKLLLKNIEAQINTGDFVLILGGSGAGKTTLIRSIMGERRFGEKTVGKVVLEGKDLYSNFKRMKSQIGIVPQFLTLRLNDTVKKTIIDEARIKLGKGYSTNEINQRVEKIMKDVGIKSLENHLISQLSGGQKKKVSVAVQLVGFQKVFICDEPDSGLDAASRIQQMGLLKEISLSNKIVMVITHEPDDAYDLFTKVIVLAKSSKDGAGHTAYFGDVQGAMEFFGVKRLQDIMLKINPVVEGGEGLADKFIEKYKKRFGGY